MVVRLFRYDRLQIAYRYDCKEYYDRLQIANRYDCKDYADTLVRLVQANPDTLGRKHPNYDSE